MRDLIVAIHFPPGPLGSGAPDGEARTSAERSAWRCAARILPVLLLAGCAYSGTARDFDPECLNRETGWIALRHVPMLHQEALTDCGAAALAMVLGGLGMPSSVSELVKACPPEAGQGIRAGALRDYARRRGLQAYLFEASLEDLERELRLGRPLLVGLVQPYGNRGETHYEVVVGIHPGNRQILTLDPARGWRVDTFEGFLAEWKPASCLLLLVYPGSEAPRAGPPAKP